tara:strand:- start:533 stop:706 length:174 start_codon:yes stop_codon:yes gene_type:complete
MKVGDLITIHPAAQGLYLILEKLEDEYLNTGGALWLLQGPEGVVRMSEKWMEVICKI